MPAAAGGIAFFGTYMFGAPPPAFSAYSRWRLLPLIGAPRSVPESPRRSREGATAVTIAC